MPPSASADLPGSGGSRRGNQESIAVLRILSSYGSLWGGLRGPTATGGTGLGLRRGHLTADPALPRVVAFRENQQDLQDEFSSISKVLHSPLWPGCACLLNAAAWPAAVVGFSVA